MNITHASISVILALLVAHTATAEKALHITDAGAWMVTSGPDGALTRVKIELDHIWDDRTGDKVTKQEPPEPEVEGYVVLMHSIPGCAACEKWWANRRTKVAAAGWNVVKVIHDPKDPEWSGVEFPFFEVYADGVRTVVKGLLSLADLAKLEKEIEI